MPRFSRSTRRTPNQALSRDACYAKSTAAGDAGLTVLDHCRIVGSVACALVARLPGAIADRLPQGIVTLAATHDVGKCSPGYQQKYFSEEIRRLGLLHLFDTSAFYEPKHAVTSEAALRSWGQDHRDPAWLSWAQVVGVHHGTRIIPRPERGEQYGGPAWQAVRREVIEALRQEFGDLPKAEASDESILLASGLTSVADWLGSDERWFPPAGLSAEADLADLAGAALDEAGWVSREIRLGLSFDELFGGEFRPNALQSSLFDAADAPGVYVVEAPTGMGKTEAALWAAYRLMSEGQNNGLYFALPTRLTSDRIHRRVEPFVRAAFGSSSGVRLAHGRAWLMERMRGGEELAPGGSWFRPSKRALLEPFGVGTIDQALLAVMSVRHAFVRAFGLAGKVVILDEVHSYDMYTGTLLDKLVELLRRLGCSVIVTSATLTARRRARLLGETEQTEDRSYPLITATTARGSSSRSIASPPSRTIHTRFISADPGTTAEEIVAAAEAGACVLWILNTVARSQEAFGAVRSHSREGLPVGLLHSRFPAWRRESLEDDWMERLGPSGIRPVGCVLIATQVAEQSVDIDADLLVTDLAPTDMLIQRAGRLWRHPRKARPNAHPEMWIAEDGVAEAVSGDDLRAALGASWWVYAPFVLWRTHRVFTGRPTLQLPETVRDLLEATYREDDGDDPEWLGALRRSMTDRAEKLRRRALALTSGYLPALDDRDESVATRYSDYATTDVLLVREVDPIGDRANVVLVDGEAVEVDRWRRERAAARAVHRNTVRLPTFPDFKGARRPPWLACCHHDEHLAVLRVRPGGHLETLDSAATRYGYDDARGVRRLPEEEQAEVHYTEAEEDPCDESDW